ncbi:MAG TPA: globin, partial [Methylophaga sp.]|nr:globin [Methylophaga sp.]
VRLIHEHVSINKEARDSWMACMEMAMTQLDYDDELKQRLTENFLVIATLLINH